MTATEKRDYPGTENVLSHFCGSAYEDAKSNYLVDYAIITTLAGNFSELLGYDRAGAKIFDYTFPGGICDTAYNSVPLHPESTKFPAVGPQALNISTRALVGAGDDALIEGFIIQSSAPKTLILRALGPSLADARVSGALADPLLRVFDSTGAQIAMNDNWGEDDAGAATIMGDRLDPSDPAEAATLLTLPPGTYTAVVTCQGSPDGIALVEAYDLSPLSGSILANISARGKAGTGDDVLISGFIIGDISSTTVIIRAIGPSLPAGVNQPLNDPALTLFDGNGVEVGSNDNWETDPSGGFAVEQSCSYRSGGSGPLGQSAGRKLHRGRG